MNDKDKPEIKEEFCSLCVSAGLAVAGAGGIGVASTSGGSGPRHKGETDKNRKIGLYLGVASILLSIYFYYRYTQECNGGSSECA
jgi:hypothetical protein